MRVFASITSVVLAVVASSLYACGDDDTAQCGEGTIRVGSRCVVDTDATITPMAGTGGMAGSKPPVLTCGTGTVEKAGKCVPVDGGMVEPPPAKLAVGSACSAADDQCAAPATCLESDTLPGGMCTVIGCDMDHPCPTGSMCYRVTKGFNICMPYCDDDSACRGDDGYKCQPVYGTDVNFCAPPCTLTNGCPSGTNCNADNGLCEIAGCDPSAATSECKDTQTCWPDTQGLSDKGGLCLVLCDPNDPKKTCKVDEKDEVCQPLAEDPANTGFCAPPVCTKTEDCPAGAECQSSVCQPPALCDDDNPCASDADTCVSGKCLHKCPTGSGESCADFHPGLVCADVLDVPACLPLGSFPGSACRPNRDDACSDMTVGDSTAPMVCENDVCLVDCGTGGQDLCTAIDDDLICAVGIFDEDLCLPKGAFPGGPCDANNECAQDLQGNPVVDMKCVSGTCVIDCNETDQWPGYGDALCAIVDPSLTCAGAAGSICVRACGTAGACDTGYSCLDPGSLPDHENSCLPTGSFPGSPCATGSTCSPLSASVNQVCVNDTCVVDCDTTGNAAVDDALCTAVDASLTCSESASDICVLHCNGGACEAGYSCLNPGTENACLPTGSFPGSPCRTTAGDECDQDVGGNAAVDMKCVSNACVVDCNTAGNGAADDALCTAVSSVLTCSESAGDICVLHCNAGACPTGYSCLDPAGENACLPTGSFPGSPCAAGNTCLDLPGGINQLCVNNTCVVDCDTAGDATADDGLCAAVDPSLTCSESADNVCVFACDGSGACPTGYSCLDPGGENACLPDGTFPGSACRGGTTCDDLAGGLASMVCTDTGICVVDCNTPGNAAADDGLCAAIDPSLTCSETAGDICVFACDAGACPAGYSCFDAGGENACLPNGTFPGSTCRSTVGDECDVLSGGLVVMVCTASNVCAIDCDTAGPAGADDGFCAAVDPSLTCSETAGNLCVLSCTAGVCPDGYSCFDAGGENACLPDGTFPGAACRTSGTPCDSILGGAVSMECAAGTCAIDCNTAGNAAADDGLCTTIDPSLTCSESASDICVPACGGAGQCPAGFSCLNQGTENACLPTGSFPGSPCAAGDVCYPVPSGSSTADQVCVQGTCVVSCATGGNTTCTGVNAALTCSEAAGNLCVLACGGGGSCPPNYSCLLPGVENECLPTGSFPGSPCRTAAPRCDSDLKGIADADLSCIDPGSGEACLLPCTGNNDTLCGQVDSSLTCFNAVSLCVLKCQQGLCPPGYTCNAISGDGDLCLPSN